ncbi:MAG: multiheme c-type cytochrome [Thermoleophilia bacterium]|nr:multiheme c-type cytochrome [Thermoleophilia bacterium]
MFKSTDFTDPSTCGSCHSDIFAQWQGSMHNNAFQDKFYLKMHDEASKDTNGAVDAYCTFCHTPIGTMSGEVPPTSGPQISEISKKGVQCDLCHTVTSANFTFAPSKIKQGPFTDSISTFHETAYNELFTKSEFCGMCHDVNHPDNNLALEATYTEWKSSPYAAQGIQCQDCHMTPGPGVTKPNPGKAATGGPERTHIYTHQFVGGNATSLASPEHQKLAVAQLQAAASLSISSPPSVVPGGDMELQVTVNNRGAGHYLPTGLTEVREMWLDIDITDANGKTIYRSGAVGENGSVDPKAVMYQTLFSDKDGQPTHKPWLAVATLSDNRIPPMGSATEKYSVTVPAGTSMPLTVKAGLRYRTASQSFVDELMGVDAVEMPVIDMANATAEAK